MPSEHEDRINCRCGNRLSLTDDPVYGYGEGKEDLLGASFVHLSKPFLQYPSSSEVIDYSIEYNHGFIAANDYIKTLLSIAENRTDSSSSRTPFLCGSCITRVSSALEADTVRLQDETALYDEFVIEEEDRMRKLESIVNMSFNLISKNDDDGGSTTRSSSSTSLNEDPIHRFTSDFSLNKDIEHIKQLCNEHEQNLMEMTSLFREQVHLSQLLLQQEEELLTALNDLELKGQQFNDLNSYLMMKCVEVQREVSLLNRVQLHSSLFHLSIDDRGWRYPLVNSLRLSHKPKGDLAWSEISAAWSQASQLAMFLGNAYDFTSPNLRIIPLSTCAKIIEFQKGSRVAYNMGVELDSLNTMSSTKKGVDTIVHSIYLFHQYLTQLLKHVEQTKHRVSPVLYKRLDTDIEKLQEDDDPGWSAVIHSIAATLKWLSEHATVHSHTS